MAEKKCDACKRPAPTRRVGCPFCRMKLCAYCANNACPGHRPESRPPEHMGREVRG